MIKGGAPITTPQGIAPSPASTTPKRKAPIQPRKNADMPPSKKCKNAETTKPTKDGGGDGDSKGDDSKGDDREHDDDDDQEVAKSGGDSDLEGEDHDEVDG